MGIQAASYATSGRASSGQSAAERLRAAALIYHRMGANVLPIRGGDKRPAGKWQQWQTTRQTERDVRRFSWAGWRTDDGADVQVTGFGILSGVNGWMCFDLDQLTDWAVVGRILTALDLDQDYPWQVISGSGQGAHVWIRCSEPLPVAELRLKHGETGVYTGLPLAAGGFHHLELRAAHCQTVLPPSEHPTGPGYRWAHPHKPPCEAPAVVTAAQVLRAFRAVAIPQELDQAPANLNISQHSTARPRPERRTSTSTDYPTKFTALAEHLFPDLDHGKHGNQMVRCPFHGDEHASLSVDLDHGIGFCFGSGCAANGGGGYLWLRDLSIRFFGFDPERQTSTTAAPGAVSRDTGPDNQVNPAPAAVDRLMPWALTSSDWAACPFCATVRTRMNREWRLVVGHWDCKQRDCPVAQKRRAGRTLRPVTTWPALFLGVVHPALWRRTRDAAARTGGQVVGIPLESGDILTVASVAVEHLDHVTDTYGALQQLTAACIAQPAGSRIRQAHKDKAALADVEGAGPTVATEPVEAAPAARAGVSRKSFDLHIPPDREHDLLAACEAIGITWELGAKGWTAREALTDDQVRGAALIWSNMRAELREEMRAAAMRRASIVSNTASPLLEANDGPTAGAGDQDHGSTHKRRSRGAAGGRR